MKNVILLRCVEHYKKVITEIGEAQLQHVIQTLVQYEIGKTIIIIPIDSRPAKTFANILALELHIASPISSVWGQWYDKFEKEKADQNGQQTLLHLLSTANAQDADTVIFLSHAGEVYYTAKAATKKFSPNKDISLFFNFGDMLLFFDIKHDSDPVFETAMPASAKK